MALPNRIQQTIDAARERVRRRRAPPEDAASFGAEQSDESGRVRRAARTAAEGTKRAAKGIAERREGRTVGNKRTVEESPEERATRSARAQPVMEATLAPFGGEEQPDRGAIALQRMVGGVDPEPDDRSQSTDRGAEDGFDMVEFASVGLEMDDGAERGADAGSGGGRGGGRGGGSGSGGFDLWGGEI